MGVDFLDILNAAGEGAIKKAFDAAERLAGPDMRVVSRTPLSVARAVLTGVFAPAVKGTRWSLARHGDQWWMYSPAAGCWKVVSDEQVRSLARSYLHGWKTYGKIDKDTGEPTLVRLNVSKALLNDVLDAMAGEVRVVLEHSQDWVRPTHTANGRPRFVDVERDGAEQIIFGRAEGPIRPQDVIAFPNGLLDASRIEEVVLRPHTPLWFSGSCLPFELPVERMRQFFRAWAPAVEEGDREAIRGLEDELYEDVCPLWVRKVREVFHGDEVDETNLQKWFGYVRSGDRSHQVIFNWQGPPGSLKGTGSRILTSLLGEGMTTEVTLRRLGDDPYILATAVHHDLLLCPDTHVSGRTDLTHATELLKSMSGGDRFTVRDLYQSYRTGIRPRCKIMLLSDHRLRLPDPSNSLSRRLVMVRSREGYDDRAKRLGGQQADDTRLEERLMEELPGISLWALIGYVKLRRDGRFVMSEDARREIDEMKAANAPVYAFVQEKCVIQEGSMVECGVMRKAFKEWADAEGHGKMAEMAATTFGAQLKAAFSTVRREQVTAGEYRGKRVYVGVRPLLGTEEAGEPGEPREVMHEEDLETPEWLRA